MRIACFLVVLGLFWSPAGARAASPLVAGPLVAPAPAPARVLVADGPPSVLISQAQREALGLKNGPDSIVDLWRDGGQSFLVFSGAARLADGMAGGATFRVAVDPELRTISGPLQVLLRATCRDSRPDGGRACQQFDSDYAGAGTVFPCPGGRVVYFYHGENHTMPNGQHPRGGNQGWTGIGQATWDPARGVFVKEGQIAGLNTPNRWVNGGDTWLTGQTAAASGNPSVAPDPTGTYLYLYFADRTTDPAATGRGEGCDTHTCWAVARAPIRAVCAAAGTGHPAPWLLWHDGAFGAQALLAGGIGGVFTPLLAHAAGEADNLANVTYVPGLHLYVMAERQRPGDSLAVRTSTDGLAWTLPTALVPADPAGWLLSYPRIVVLDAGGKAPRFVLTYVARQGRGWQVAELRRQALTLRK